MVGVFNLGKQGYKAELFFRMTRPVWNKAGAMDSWLVLRDSLVTSSDCMRS